jgi:flagellar basal body rod protein FlgC
MQALSTAAAGVTAAFARADASAARTVRSGATGPEVDLAQEAAQGISAVAELGANVAVARTADQMLGALLDIRA